MKTDTWSEPCCRAARVMHHAVFLRQRQTNTEHHVSTRPCILMQHAAAPVRLWSLAKMASEVCRSPSASRSMLPACRTHGAQSEGSRNVVMTAHVELR